METMETVGSFQKVRNKFSRFYKDIYAKINERVVLNRTFVDVGTELIKGVAQYTLHGKPSFLIEGTFNALKEIGSASYYPKDFFSEINGWEQLMYHSTNIAHLFISVIEKYPSQNLKFSNYDKTSVRVVELPLGKIGVVQSGERDYATSNIYFRPTEINRDELRKFLIDQFIDLLDTKCFSVAETARNYYGTNISIVAEDLTAIHSQKTDEYLGYIKDCLDKNISRAFLFYGPPGTGKTTLARSLVKELGFRTLKFRYSSGYDFSIFKFVVQAFGIEAVFIDDFDVVNEPTGLLEFFEFLKKEVKLVIAVANSLEEFHPAILRPDRIDEIRKIDTLEEDTVRSIMGKLYKGYGGRVKKWPVAYIQEFVRRDKIGKQSLAEAYKELDERVRKQLEKLKPKAAK